MSDVSAHELAADLASEACGLQLALLAALPQSVDLCRRLGGLQQLCYDCQQL